MPTFKNENQDSGNRIIIVICEGPSEVAYLNELNKVLREEEIFITFCPKSAGNGHYSNVEKKYKEVLRKERKNKINELIIWIDKDIYTRNECKCAELYTKKPKNIPDFYFNKYNFEDMLILHYPIETIKKWQKICEDHGHFKKPLISKQHEDLFKDNIEKDYEKGNFILTNFNLNSIKNAIDNNNDNKILFESDFLKFIEKNIFQDSFL